MAHVVLAPSQRHPLHREGSVWRETNCYTDVWIELLHALGHEPLAMLGPCLRVGLEADQWTFFKPSFDDLFSLYGVTVVEANPWQGLLATCVNAVATGRVALPEVDSWFLPDTAGVAYQRAHVKSTIAVLGIDPVERSLSYAHNASCFTLHGDDFDGLFGLGAHVRDDTHLLPYVDMCTMVQRTAPEQLGECALAILLRDRDRLPVTNPFTGWAARFADELEVVRSANDESAFHNYAFTTFRQFGPAFELSARHLTWLTDSLSCEPIVEESLRAAAEHCNTIASTALVFQMRTARAVMSGKPLDPTTWMTQLIDSWQSGMDSLRSVRWRD